MSLQQVKMKETGKVLYLILPDFEELTWEASIEEALMEWSTESLLDFAPKVAEGDIVEEQSKLGGC